MKLIVTIEIPQETASKNDITFDFLCTFAEELKADALKSIPEVNVTVETLP